jgi:hypothetical protein
MAQAKTRASAKRSQSPKRSRNAKKSTGRSKNSSGSPRASSGGGSSSASRRSSNGKTRIEAVRQTVESSTKEAGQTVGKAASKAKTPLLAGSAALAGAAGGLAIGAMRSRQAHSHKVLGVKLPQRKRVKIRSRDVAKAAKEVGSFSQHVGELATELRHAREESGNGSKHRSPVEVVLDGLTARR